MSTETEIREFLTTRRAKLTPEQAGLPTFGRQRRVAGLRREEVALLAGISVEYYTRLERGNARGVSDGVLDSICDALQLNDAERDHLNHLARTVNAERPPRRAATPQKVRPSIARIVDSMTGVAATVRNSRLDLLYANDLGRALFSEMFRDPRGANLARFAFLDPRSHLFWPDWERAASDTVAVLHAEAGRNPYDRGLSDLIGELSTRSDDFRLRWAAHDVKNHRSGVKELRHPLVGDLTLTFEAIELPADPGLALGTYAAEPGTVSAERFAVLERWAAMRAGRAATAADDGEAADAAASVALSDGTDAEA
jgi:transcriptional regulator with XRE-family HTH domain